MCLYFMLKPVYSSEFRPPHTIFDHIIFDITLHSYLNVLLNLTLFDSIQIPILGHVSMSSRNIILPLALYKYPYWIMSETQGELLMTLSCHFPYRFHIQMSQPCISDQQGVLGDM